MSNKLERILTIDDDDDIRLIGSMILKKKGGYEVTTKQSGMDGIEYLNSIETSQLPDLILLDVMMPNMDGPQTLQEIKSSSDPISKIPVVFLTAKCQPDEIDRLKSIGAKAVIAKPFDAKTFAGEVQSIWNKILDQSAIR